MLSPYLFFVLFITRTNVIVIISDCNYYHLPFFFHSSHLEALFLYPLLAIIYEHLEKFDFLFYFSLLSSPFFPAFLQFAPSLFFSHPSSRKEWREQCLLLPWMCTRCNYHEPRSAFEARNNECTSDCYIQLYYLRGRNERIRREHYLRGDGTK